MGVVVLGFLAVLALSGLAAGASAPPAGIWHATGNEFRGTFAISPGGRDVTHFHGVALAGARKGCPVVHPGESIVLPAKIPILHDSASDTYYVDAKVTNLPLATTVIAGGVRHTGAIQISWAAPPEAPVDITYGNLAGGCHIAFYAAP